MIPSSAPITLEVYTHLDAGDLDEAVDAAVSRSAVPSGDALAEREPMPDGA